ncbi:MAG TPA: hypothetical protein DET40_04830 [Lentisphaeria bacterium]|nr:MAG: hypothetical protein A2X45_13405 [Lentisphaerae bacterium GWF2_50_93]HCE42850.1 hypothetical protein [Lentisphaeria bacterium]
METDNKTIDGVGYCWHLLVRELLEGMFFSQQDLAEHCKVTQQSISSWKNGVRKPGDFARRRILELAREAEIDPGRYECDPVRDAITKYLEKNTGKDLVRVISLYEKMSDGSRDKLLGYAKTLAK